MDEVQQFAELKTKLWKTPVNWAWVGPTKREIWAERLRLHKIRTGT